MLTKEEIRESYKNFDDNKILNLARNPKGLTKEAIPVLIEELENRNLDLRLIDWIKLENNPLNQTEKDSIINYTKNCICSICNKSSNLKAYEFHSVVSSIIYCKYKLKHLIICTNCAKKLRWKNFLKTFFLGWWSRSGITTTFISLSTEFFNLFLVDRINKRILNSFLEENNGKLRKILKSQNPKQEIQKMLEKINASNLNI